MEILGSVIARLGSKRLTYKNLLPYKGVPLVVRALQKLLDCQVIDRVVLSTDSELIARTCLIDGVEILYRPENLSGDDVASIPVFQHILENFTGDLHLNYNCNFPECDSVVIERAVSVAREKGEALSNPFAIWAQTRECLENYGDPFQITATQFDAPDIHPLDIHAMDDLLEVHRMHQSNFCWDELKKS